jgi:phosphoesterase RecJ-like protein
MPIEPAQRKMIYRHIYGSIPYQDMRLLLAILAGMGCAAQGRIVWFEIPRNLLRHRMPCFDLSEELLSFGRSIKGAEVVLLFKENMGGKNEIRINFRSQGKVDVNEVASFFGGGGHRTASGATVRGNTATVKKSFLINIKEYLK